MVHESEDYVPFPGVPRFFKREWKPRNAFMGPYLVISLAPEEGLTIYGFSARSNYPSDNRLEDRRFQLYGEFPAICFSKQEVRGEYGLVPIREVVEITEDEFRKAQEREFH